MQAEGKKVEHKGSMRENKKSMRERAPPPLKSREEVKEINKEEEGRIQDDYSQCTNIKYDNTKSSCINNKGFVKSIRSSNS